MEIVLRASIHGLVNRENLAALRRALKLTPRGRLDDREDAEFGYRDLVDDGEHRVELTLWRYSADRWGASVMADLEVLPSRAELEHLLQQIRAAAQTVGLTVEQERIWAA